MLLYDWVSECVCVCLYLRKKWRNRSCTFLSKFWEFFLFLFVESVRVEKSDINTFIPLAVELITRFALSIEHCPINFVPTFTEPSTRFEFQNGLSFIFSTLDNDVSKVINPNTSENDVVDDSFEIVPSEPFIRCFQTHLIVTLRSHFKRIAKKFGLHELILKVLKVGRLANTRPNWRMMTHLFSKETQSFLWINIFVCLSKKRIERFTYKQKTTNNQTTKWGFQNTLYSKESSRPFNFFKIKCTCSLCSCVGGYDKQGYIKSTQVRIFCLIRLITRRQSQNGFKIYNIILFIKHSKICFQTKEFHLTNKIFSNWNNPK